MFVFKNYPLPPSSNDLYSSFRGRLIKSKIARLYEFEVHNYALKMHSLIEDVKQIINQDSYIEVNSFFVFHKPRIFTKENKLKKLDASNRLKSANDTLMKILDIDDKQIISGHFEKLYCDKEHEEQVIIEIKLAKIKSLKDFDSKGIE